jgi:hypothetical protein
VYHIRRLDSYAGISKRRGPLTSETRPDDIEDTAPPKRERALLGRRLPSMLNHESRCTRYSKSFSCLGRQLLQSASYFLLDIAEIQQATSADLLTG